MREAFWHLHAGVFMHFHSCTAVAHQALLAASTSPLSLGCCVDMVMPIPNDNNDTKSVDTYLTQVFCHGLERVSRTYI